MNISYLNKSEKQIKNDLEKMNKELSENCQEQLKLLEPEYKKIINKGGALDKSGFSIFHRYNYYKSQQERLEGGKEYLQQQSNNILNFLEKNREGFLKNLKQMKESGLPPELCYFNEELRDSIRNGINEYKKEIEYSRLRDAIIKQAKKELGITDTQSEDTQAIKQTSSNNGEISQEEAGFIKYIKDEGRIENIPDSNGKYNLLENAENFIHWYIYNNYIKHEKYRFLPNYMMKYINHNCTIETLKRYVREAKKIAPTQLQNEEKMKNLKENR